jgi:hypothetical protein
MSQKIRQSPKKSKAEQVETVIRLINGGKTQAQAAAATGVNLRTVQRWIADPEVKSRLAATQREVKVIAQSDPVVVAVLDIRGQAEEILNYRDSQRNFALQMGLVVQKSTDVLLKVVERLEGNSDELSARSIPPLIRAVVDAAEKVSSSWARATALDDLLEHIANDPETDS